MRLFGLRPICTSAYSMKALPVHLFLRIRRPLGWCENSVRTRLCRVAVASVFLSVRVPPGVRCHCQVKVCTTTVVCAVFNSLRIDSRWHPPFPRQRHVRPCRVALDPAIPSVFLACTLLAAGSCPVPLFSRQRHVLPGAHACRLAPLFFRHILCIVGLFASPHVPGPSTTIFSVLAPPSL